MIRVALAQIDPCVGDIGGNVALLQDAIAEARRRDAQVLVLPELAITGYPPEDLVLKRSFIEANLEGVEEIARATGDLLVVFGFVDTGNDRLYNAAAICHDGRVLARYHKHLLPNYGVFDERRHFHRGRGHTLLETGDGVLGVCVCEDAWSPTGPVKLQSDAGAQIVLNINASPYHKGKMQERTELLSERARRANASIVYVNAVGGQDELVFDGGSLVIAPDGEVVAQLPQFAELIQVVDVPLGEAGTSRHPAIKRVALTLRAGSGTVEEAPAPRRLDAAEEIYRALELGLLDYVSKNGFSKVVIGLSGGIDSTLTAVIAVDALGAANVLGVAMPSEYSSSHSIEDAKVLASNLDIECLEVPIAPPLKSYLDILQQAFGPTESGLAEENLQARIRGNILMAISNRYGHLVLATGNKSEMACGYATLYGDMAGGFALLKDVFKTEVYALSRWRNSIGTVIPENVLVKPPSAELRPNQKDSDSLPPYEELDPILAAYIEEDAGIAEMVAAGHEPETVQRVVGLVDRAEYKRRQAPPGPKVTVKAFGRDRRLPISNRWRDSPS